MKCSLFLFDLDLCSTSGKNLSICNPLIMETVKFFHLYVSIRKTGKSLASMGDAYAGFFPHPFLRYSLHRIPAHPDSGRTEKYRRQQNQISLFQPSCTLPSIVCQSDYMKERAGICRPPLFYCSSSSSSTGFTIAAFSRIETSFFCTGACFL